MPLDIDRIRLLCFDIDGTLRDTDDQWVSRLAVLFHRLGFLFPGHDRHRMARHVVMAIENPGSYVLGLPDRLNVDHHLASLGDWLYRLGIGPRTGGRTGKFMLVDGIRKMLERLGTCYPMAVVSVRGSRTTQAFLEQSELAPFFRVIAAGQTCRHTKPYPDPILWAAAQLGVHPSSCLMIGDTTVDILAGKAAEAQTVGVLCGFGEESELLKAGADLILPSTTDLLTVLKL
jgi:phosphoglycolate phosphatase-like HAD superfamily hydrolase